MERETGLEPAIPNFATISLPDTYRGILERAIAKIFPNAPSAPAYQPTNTTAERVQPDDILDAFDGTAVGRAVDAVLDGVGTSSNLSLRAWGLRVFLRWAQVGGVDLGLIDEVALRERYLPYLRERYAQANAPMSVAHRLLDAIDEIRRIEPGTFPALPTRPQAVRVVKPRRTRGTDPIYALGPSAGLGLAVASVVKDAPSAVQMKVRRYAVGQFLTWCQLTGRNPLDVTFEDIDGAFDAWLRPRLKNWAEVKVHARSLLRQLASVPPPGATDAAEPTPQPVVSPSSLSGPAISDDCAGA